MVKIETELTDEAAETVRREAELEGVSVPEYVSRIVSAKSPASSSKDDKLAGATPEEREASFLKWIDELAARHGNNLPGIPSEKLRREHLYEDHD